MGINLKDHLTGDPNDWISEKEAERIFEAAGYKKRTFEGRTVVFDRGLKNMNVSYLGKLYGYKKIMGLNECVWCGVDFKSRKLHDEHYKACAEENYIQPTREEAWEITNNPKHY